MIYVIGRADSNWREYPIKIGYTGGFSADSRLAGVQTGNPHKLKVLATARGDRETENILHLVFNCARSNGEWFIPSSLPSEFLSAVETNQLSTFILDTMQFLEDRNSVPDKFRHLSAKALIGELEEIARELIKSEIATAKKDLEHLKSSVDIAEVECWTVHWDPGDILVKRNLQSAVEIAFEQIKSFDARLPRFTKHGSVVDYSALDILRSKIHKDCISVPGFIEQELTTKGYFSCDIFGNDAGDIVPGLLVQNYWVDMVTGKVKTKALPMLEEDLDACLSVTISVMSLEQFNNGSYSTEP